MKREISTVDDLSWRMILTVRSTHGWVGIGPISMSGPLSSAGGAAASSSSSSLGEGTLDSAGAAAATFTGGTFPPLTAAAFAGAFAVAFAAAPGFAGACRC